MIDFNERFKENLINKNLVKKDDKLLLGVSGGPDSLTMLNLFVEIRDEFNLDLLVFHLNHSFRKEAEQEAEFVKNFCEKLDINYIIKKYDVPKYVKKNNLSPEEGAREIRFNFLKEICQAKNIKKVCLAHNKDDLVETVLFNIFRGSGMRGLRGIEDEVEINGMKIIHPILIFYRSEILDYCNFFDLEPVIDPSNKSDLYSRNRIRNNIIPLIEEQINSNAKQVIARMSNTVKEDYDFINQYSKQVFEDILLDEKEDKYILNLEKFKNLHPAVIKRIINNIIIKLKGNIDNFYYNHYSDIIKFIENNKTGDILDLPEAIKLKISYEKLFVYKGEFMQIKEFSKTIVKEGEYRLPYNQKLKVEIIDEKLDWRNYKDNKFCLIDFGKVDFPLTVRNRKKGDRFIPLGMNGHKKVKDFFIDLKIPDFVRDKIPIVYNNKDELIWICGYRMDDRFKIEEKSKKTLLLKYEEEN